MLKKTLLGAVSAAVTSIAALPAYSYDALTSGTFTVGETSYDLSVVELTPSIAEDRALLQQTSWHIGSNDDTLAASFAEVVSFDLGDSTGELNPTTPPAEGTIYGPNFSFQSQDTVLRYALLEWRSVDETFTQIGSFTESVFSNWNTPMYFVVETSLIAAATPEVASKSLRPAAYTSAPDLIPSNVPTCSGSKFVSGVQVLGNGGIQWYVEHSKKDECFNVDVTVLPEGVSAKDMSAVMAALGSSNFDVYALR